MLKKLRWTSAQLKLVSCLAQLSHFFSNLQLCAPHRLHESILLRATLTPRNFLRDHQRAACKRANDSSTLHFCVYTGSSLFVHPSLVAMIIKKVRSGERQVEMSYIVAIIKILRRYRFGFGSVKLPESIRLAQIEKSYGLALVLLRVQKRGHGTRRSPT